MDKANNELIQENVKLTQRVKQLELELAKRDEQLAAKDKELTTAKELNRCYWHEHNKRYEEGIAKDIKFSEKFENVCMIIAVMILLFVVAAVFMIALNGIATLCVWFSTLI